MLKKSFLPNDGKKLLDNKGMATLEIIPIVTVIILLLNFSIGFFGAIHTGILQSISSRNYAFETFSNRSDLTYLKNTGDSPADLLPYNKLGLRIHATMSEQSSGVSFVAAARKIAFFEKKNAVDIEGEDVKVHSETSNLAAGRNEKISVNPIWIKSSYGICLNSQCKGN